MRPSERRPAGAGALVVLRLVGWAAVAAMTSVALAATPPSAPAASDARAQRGLQMMEARERIMTSQAGMAAGVARWRARELYRFLRAAPAADTDERPPIERARAIRVGLGALGRELGEARLLAGELALARAERAGLPLAEAPAPALVSPPGTAALPTPRPPAPLFAPPLAGAAVGFGPGRDAATGVWLFRSGVRIDGRAGDAVRAVADGVVDRVAPSPGGGLALVIDHGGGWTSILARLDEVAVAPGQRVTRGQRVGRVAGVAGAAAGITFDLWRGRSPVDPAQYMPAKSAHF
jgi:murein DD-endopeptidase MepM/ murein hydrolase activator NlpD